MTVAYVGLGTLSLSAAWVVVARQGLIAARDRADAAWHAVDEQLRRRRDLVPSVVASVRETVDDAEDLLARLIAAEARVAAAATPLERDGAERHLVGALLVVSALAERHASLGGSAAFVDVQARMVAVEDDIQAARRLYNADVRLYIARRAHFPAWLVAHLGEFADRPYFELDHTRDRLGLLPAAG